MSPGRLSKELVDPDDVEINVGNDEVRKVRHNTFKAYYEEGGEELKEADDDTARFWLLENYEGMVFVDEDQSTARSSTLSGM